MRTNPKYTVYTIALTITIGLAIGYGALFRFTTVSLVTLFAMLIGAALFWVITRLSAQLALWLYKP